MQASFVGDGLGELYVWHKPKPEHQYVVFSDSAEGLRNSDKAAAQVIDVETGTQCAEWETQMAPTPWSIKSCLLASWYNNAVLAFETGVSAHGVSAANTALRIRYPNLYRRRALDTADRKMMTKLGWATTQVTKPMMIDAIRDALQHGLEINSERLLEQMNRTKLSDPPKVQAYTDGNDDLLIAYGGALRVRLELWSSGGVHVKAAPRERLTDDDYAALMAERDEALYDGSLDPETLRRQPREEIWDGSNNPWVQPPRQL